MSDTDPRMRPWYRMEVGWMRDGRVIDTGFAWAWVVIIDTLKRGFGEADDADLTDRALCAQMQVPCHTTGRAWTIRDAFADVGLIVKAESGKWRASNWRKFQSDPTANIRQQKSRAARKSAESTGAAIEPGNVTPVTVTSRDVTAPNGRSRTEKENEKDKHNAEVVDDVARAPAREDDFAPPPPAAAPSASREVTDASPIEDRVAHVVALYARITGEQPRPGDDMALARWCSMGRPLAAISVALYRMAEEAKRKAGDGRPAYSVRFADAVLCKLREDELDPAPKPAQAPNRAPTGTPSSVSPPVVYDAEAEARREETRQRVRERIRLTYDTDIERTRAEDARKHAENVAAIEAERRAREVAR